MTCDYWNEIWLNEGFATYWQGAAVDAVRPELDNMGTFYTDDATVGLDIDSKPKSTHPLSAPAGVCTQLLIAGSVHKCSNARRKLGMAARLICKESLPDMASKRALPSALQSHKSCGKQRELLVLAGSVDALGHGRHAEEPCQHRGNV